jgi:beta-lactam-binding protein with PASTA domain
MSLFSRFSLDAVEGYVSGHLRIFISLVLALVVFVGLIALMVFFIALRGAEETMVPDVRNKELTAALLELQVKELYPRLQLRYSETPEEKGIILEQDPAPGTIVKAGRRIRLVVSQGMVVNAVENYRGRDIDEVRMDLRTLFASAPQPLLSLNEPFMYEYSGEAPGTILQQSPEPGTPISGPTVLEFVVSRGPEHNQIAAPDLRGLTVAEALEQIRQSRINFAFTLRPQRNGERAGIVVYQDPAEGAVMPANQAVSILVSAPTAPVNGEVFGLFKYPIPRNPYPLTVRLEVLPSTGERQLLAEVEYLGGEFTVPYQLPPGSVLILSMHNRELYREEIRPPVEGLSLDQL